MAVAWQVNEEMNRTLKEQIIEGRTLQNTGEVKPTFRNPPQGDAKP